MPGNTTLTIKNSSPFSNLHNWIKNFPKNIIKPKNIKKQREAVGWDVIFIPVSGITTQYQARHHFCIIVL